MYSHVYISVCVVFECIHSSMYIFDCRYVCTCERVFDYSRACVCLRDCVSLFVSLPVPVSVCTFMFSGGGWGVRSPVSLYF